MARPVPDEDEKRLHWVGPAREELMGFPDAVQDDIGSALSAAQFGGKAGTAKPWKGAGSGVLEIVENHDGNAYRAVYTVRFSRAVYVLHAFQKKSTRGIQTAKKDVEAVDEALKAAKEHYERIYGREQ
jgi:phage-related protein